METHSVCQAIQSLWNVAAIASCVDNYFGHQKAEPTEIIIYAAPHERTVVGVSRCLQPALTTDLQHGVAKLRGEFYIAGEERSDGGAGGGAQRLLDAHRSGL